MTMRPSVATQYARCDRAERRLFDAEVIETLMETAPSAKIVGSINFSTRVLIEDAEFELLRRSMSERFLVEHDYTMVTL